MDARGFEFEVEGSDGLHQVQRVFLQHVESLIRELAPPDLDVSAVDAHLDDGRLTVRLPHRHDQRQEIVATVTEDEVIVAYGEEHEHFWPNDPAAGREWPIDARDLAVASARFVEQFFRGRIELEVRLGLLMRKTKSYWINDAGERELFLTGGTLWPSLRREHAQLLRFDFGLPNGTTS